MVSPFMAKCKRRALSGDGPTPCLCCPGECVGDDLSIQMLPEVEAMLNQRHGVEGVRTCDPLTRQWEDRGDGEGGMKPPVRIEITAQFTVCGRKFDPVNLVPLLGLALLVGIVLLIGSTTMR